MSYYLILDDKQLNRYSEELGQFCDNLESAAQIYDMLIDRVQAEGVVAGKTHDALVTFQQYTRRLKEIADNVGVGFQAVLKAFQTEIETADDYLYDAGILQKKRDFSQTLYDFLQYYLDWVGGQAGSAFESWVKGLYYDVTDFFSKLFSGSADSVSRARKRMQDDYGRLLSYNRETSLGLKNLFDLVHSVDAEYAARLAETVAILTEIAVLAQEMAAVVDPANKGGFSVEAMKHLSQAMNQMEKAYQRFIQHGIAGGPPSADNILDYVNQNPQSSTPGFDSFQTADNTFLYEYVGSSGSSVMTTIGIAFFNFWNINKDAFTNQLKNIIGEDLTYEEYVELQKMAETVDSLNKEKTAAQKAYGEQEEYFKLLKEELGKSKDATKDIYKILNSIRDKNGKLILDGRTKEAKRLKEFTKQLGSLEKIMKYGAKAADYLEALFADYSRQQDIIESMEQSAGNSEKAQATIRRLKKIYDSRWSVILDKLENDAGEMVYDAGMTALSKATPGLNVAIAGIDIIGNATGLGPKYRAAYEAMEIKEAAGTSEGVYRQAVANLRNADPSDPDYNKLVENVRNTFELHKKNLESMYNKMAEAMSGEDKAYYQYCAQQVRSMSLDKPQPTIMSHKEYTTQSVNPDNPVCINPNQAKPPTVMPTPPVIPNKPNTKYVPTTNQKATTESKPQVCQKPDNK